MNYNQSLQDSCSNPPVVATSVSDEYNIGWAMAAVAEDRNLVAAHHFQHGPERRRRRRWLVQMPAALALPTAH